MESKVKDIGLYPGKDPIQNHDLSVFETLFYDIIYAYTYQDYTLLRRLTTSEFERTVIDEIESNTSARYRNEVTEVEIIEATLLEYWQKDDLCFVNVRFRYDMKDTYYSLEQGVPPRSEYKQACEIWTFVRDEYALWNISEIQSYEP